MSRRTFAWLSILGFVAISVSALNYAVADAPTATANSDEHSFGDGILYIVAQQTAGIEVRSNTCALKNAKLIKLGDRFFIRGIGYAIEGERDKRESGWIHGIDTGFRWNDVAEFYYFPTEEKYEKFRMAYEESEKE